MFRCFNTKKPFHSHNTHRSREHFCAIFPKFYLTGFIMCLPNHGILYFLIYALFIQAKRARSSLFGPYYLLQLYSPLNLRFCLPLPSPLSPLPSPLSPPPPPPPPLPTHANPNPIPHKQPATPTEPTSTIRQLHEYGQHKFLAELFFRLRCRSRWEGVERGDFQTCALELCNCRRTEGDIQTEVSVRAVFLDGGVDSPGSGNNYVNVLRRKDVHL